MGRNLVLQPELPYDRGKSRKRNMPIAIGDTLFPDTKDHIQVNVGSMFYLMIATALMDNTGPHKISAESRTELDSHANMPVVGMNAYVISQTGRSASVNPYNPDYSPMDKPIVDAAVLL